MIPRYYKKLSQVPNLYKVPDEIDLAQNTEYPNLNSRDYTRRPLNRTARMHDAWECISLNTSYTINPKSNCNSDKSNIVVACNKLSGREWSSSLWGFEQSEVMLRDYLINSEMSCFKLQCSTQITCMEFISNNTLLLAFSCGKLQLWSTYSEVRNSKHPYCLFLIGENYEHIRSITSMTSFPSNTFKAITCSKNGSIKLWDMGAADLHLQQAYNFGHTDSITGVTTDSKSHSIFATCSFDKSCLLWDIRETRPAIALFEDHLIRFRDVCWSLENVDNIMYLGDESGQIFVIDIRKPHSIVKCHKYFDCPIKKIKPKGDNIAVIGDTNIVKISSYYNHQVFYENTDSQNIVRDCAWLAPTILLSVGFEGKLRKHEIDLQQKDDLEEGANEIVEKPTNGEVTQTMNDELKNLTSE